jgi:uncharacterized membrane protein YdjX (TVP38/TMEM64 family)
MRGLSLAILAVAGTVIYNLHPVWLEKIIHMLLKGDVGAIIGYIRSFGPYAMMVSFFIIVAINVVAVLPNIFVLAASGILFGIVDGVLIAWLGESIGVIISFFIMRYFLHDYAHNLIIRRQGLKAIDEFSGRKGFAIMLLARAIPFVPSGLLTALGAVSSITAIDYIFATLIGKIPSAVIEVMLGHDLASYRQHEMRLLLLFLISGAAYFLFLRYKKRHKR